LPHQKKPMQRSKNGHLRLADLPADYKKLGIAPLKSRSLRRVSASTRKGRYESWHFDSHLDNGATLVVVFYTKPNVMITIVAASLSDPHAQLALGARQRRSLYDHQITRLIPRIGRGPPPNGASTEVSAIDRRQNSGGARGRARFIVAVGSKPRFIFSNTQSLLRIRACNGWGAQIINISLGVQ
jgi:hypothetical protein